MWLTATKVVSRIWSLLSRKVCKGVQAKYACLYIHNMNLSFDHNRLAQNSLWNVSFSTVLNGSGSRFQINSW